MISRKRVRGRWRDADVTLDSEGFHIEDGHTRVRERNGGDARGLFASEDSLARQCVLASSRGGASPLGWGLSLSLSLICPIGGGLRLPTANTRLEDCQHRTRDPSPRGHFPDSDARNKNTPAGTCKLLVGNKSDMDEKNVTTASASRGAPPSREYLHIFFFFLREIRRFMVCLFPFFRLSKCAGVLRREGVRGLARDSLPRDLCEERHQRRGGLPHHGAGAALCRLLAWTTRDALR